MALHDPRAVIEGIILAPAGLVGCITGAILKHAPIKTAQDVVIFALMIFAIHLPLIGVFALIQRRKKVFFGHSWQSWFGLVVVSYGLGFALSVWL
jgi:tellurite resistance protein TehA-like permease